MITKDKIKVYQYFKGDIDGWARLGTIEQKTTIEEKDWSLIDDLLQSIDVYKRGLVSSEYEELIDVKLKASCDDEETLNILKGMNNVSY